MVPWSRDTARVICNVFYPPDSEGVKMIPFEKCCRSILADVEKLARKVLIKHLDEIFPKKKIDHVHIHFAPELEFLLGRQDYDWANIYLD
jgi:glutamine synthetase